MTIKSLKFMRHLNKSTVFQILADNDENNDSGW